MNLDRGKEGDERLHIPEGQPWDDGRWACAILHAAGHEAWLVGGCVRDLLLHRPVHDVDIATSAHPDHVSACFERTLAVGKSFGVMIALHPSGRQLEIASFRTDGLYVDGRRPSTVQFATAEQDAHRRDFTINALFLDPNTGTVVDHVAGRADIRAGVIRVIDGPLRLSEDRLRVLRALRFAAHLNFTIEPATWCALLATSLTGLARERIWQEIMKGLSQSPAAWCRLMCEAGLAEAIIPEPGIGPGAISRLARLSPSDNPIVALALLLDDVPAGRLWPWLKTEPVSREQQQRIRWLREAAVIIRENPEIAVRRRLMRHPDAALLKSYLIARQEVNNIEKWYSEEQATTVIPWLRAEDILSLGIPSGPMVGRLLRELDDAQLAGTLTSREAAVSWVRRASQPGYNGP